MFEVLETSWETLQGKLDSAHTLDDIIHAHNTYLSDIMGKALLHPDSKDVSDKLIEARLYACSAQCKSIVLEGIGPVIASKGGGKSRPFNFSRKTSAIHGSSVFLPLEILVLRKKNTFQGFAREFITLRILVI